MTATTAEITAFVDLGGVATLVSRLGITRAQAEALEIVARRALLEGRELSPLEIPTGSVAGPAARQRREGARAPLTPEQERARVLLARLDPPAETPEQIQSRLDHERRQATYARNIAQGYEEWRPLLDGDHR